MTLEKVKKIIRGLIDTEEYNNRPIPTTYRQQGKNEAFSICLGLLEEVRSTRKDKEEL